MFLKTIRENLRQTSFCVFIYTYWNKMFKYIKVSFLNKTQSSVCLYNYLHIFNGNYIEKSSEGRCVIFDNCWYCGSPQIYLRMKYCDRGGFAGKEIVLQFWFQNSFNFESLWRAWKTSRNHPACQNHLKDADNTLSNDYK